MERITIVGDCMKQGTVSVLFGCHSIVHSFLVLASWRILYGRFPKFWQIVCIFIHDIGHWGLDYLDNEDEKKKHWILGAKIAFYLYGKKGFFLCAGRSFLAEYGVNACQRSNQRQVPPC